MNTGQADIKKERLIKCWSSGNEKKNTCYRLDRNKKNRFVKSGTGRNDDLLNRGQV